MKAAPRIPAILLGLAAIASCDSPTEPTQEPVRRPSVVNYVVGEAALALDSRGNFILLSPQSLEPHAITADFAARAAEGFIRVATGPNVITLTGAMSTKRSLESMYGRPIDWSRLTADLHNTFYVVPAFEPLPDSVPKYVQRYLSGSFLVPIMVGRDQVAVIRVASDNDEIWIDEGGKVHKPAFSGNEFFPHGVKADWERFPIGPEDAAIWLARATGRRVASVPRLEPPPYRWASMYALWRVVLDEPVETIASSGQRLFRDTLYVGFGQSVGDTNDPDRFQMRAYVPAANQPETETVSYRLPSSTETRSVFLQRRPGIVGAYEPATIQR